MEVRWEARLRRAVRVVMACILRRKVFVGLVVVCRYSVATSMGFSRNSFPPLQRF